MVKCFYKAQFSYMNDSNQIGLGGKQSKKKLEKLGFEPQITIPKMPHVRQSSSEGCPLACGTMLLNFAGIKKTYKELQTVTRNWKRMNEFQLRNFIESFGLKTIPLRNLEEAKKTILNGKPVVAFVDRSEYGKGGLHWIVLRGV